MSELYVYYKLQAGQAAAALAAFRSACADAPVRLLQRRDGAEPALLTWMEIYGADVNDALGLERRLAEALAPFVQGERHREFFEEL